PTGRCVCTSPTCLARYTPMHSLRLCALAVGNRQKPPHGWHWRPCCSVSRTSLTAVLPMRYRGRIDWKYALGLALTDPGFHHTVLSGFRSRLVAGGAELRLLDTLLERLRERKLIKTRGRQRTDSTHALAAVRVLNRLEQVGETLRAALNSVAVVAP